MGEQRFSDAEINRAIKSVEREHLCRCEVCSRASAICPASASTLILELAGRRLDILGKQREIVALEAERDALKARAEAAEADSALLDALYDDRIEFSFDGVGPDCYAAILGERDGEPGVVTWQITASHRDARSAIRAALKNRGKMTPAIHGVIDEAMRAAAQEGEADA